MSDVRSWFDAIFLDLARQMRWSFLPPLMIYFAYGASGITSIVGTFFVKEYLDVSAAFIAGLAFWAGLPWALKMPLGHLVDLIWRWKGWLIWLGAALMTASFVIMYGLTTRAAWMTEVMSATAWYVLAVMLAPCGYVIQDAVADAMSVEAVPKTDDQGTPLPTEVSRTLHTTMQTLGRFALISGVGVVAAANIYLFSGIEALSAAQKDAAYGRIYLLALLLPCLSVCGVSLAAFQARSRIQTLMAAGLARAQAQAQVLHTPGDVRLNHWYFTGGAAFVALTLAVGLGDVPYSQEIVFTGSMLVVLALMRQLLRALTPDQARMLVGTAIIIFVFRAVPRPGAGQTWFEIDILGFDQQFLSVLALITAVMTLAGMVVLRPLMAQRTIVYITILLTIAAGILSIPNLALYYGVHEWTAAQTGGVVDARFIAIMDTAVESPLGQIAMIPMLAWIARNAPANLKATFFAVMASFTNLALSASNLGSRYLNEVFVVTREVVDAQTGAITVAADYSQLGWLLLSVVAITVVAPLIAIWMVQSSKLRTTE